MGCRRYAWKPQPPLDGRDPQGQRVTARSKNGRLAQGERSPAFREFINVAGLEMKFVDEHIESIGARGDDCESHGWARNAPACPLPKTNPDFTSTQR